MRLFLGMLAAIAVSLSVGSQAFAAAVTSPAHEIRVWDVPFTASLDKSVFAYTCGGVVTDGLLIRMPSDAPYELRIHALQIDYRGFSWGHDLLGIEPKEQVSGGLRELLFQGLKDVVVILRHGRSEYRMVIVESC